jgi:putative flippase GtrA
LIKGFRDRGGGTLMRFVVIGVSCAGLFFLLCYVLQTMAKLGIFSSTILAYAGAFAAGYLGQRSWAFKSQAGHLTTLPRYAAMQIGCAIFTAYATHAVANRAQISPFVSSLLATLIASGASFLISSAWVFAEARSESK